MNRGARGSLNIFFGVLAAVIIGVAGFLALIHKRPVTIDNNIEQFPSISNHTSILSSISLLSAIPGAVTLLIPVIPVVPPVLKQESIPGALIIPVESVVPPAVLPVAVGHVAKLVVVEVATTTPVVVVSIPLASLKDARVSEIILLTNAERAHSNIPLLKESGALDIAVQAKTDDEAKLSYFSHKSPTGEVYTDFIAASGYKPLCPDLAINCMGENLAQGYSSFEAMLAAFMLSPEHKKNIMDVNFQDIGVGLTQGMYQGKSVLFVAIYFGRSQ